MSPKKLPVLPALLFLSVFFLYLHNLSRSVYGGDVGDLVTAAYVFGVPHAPGYPLFTLLGFLLSHLPLGSTVALRVGLISAFSGSMLVVLYFLIARSLTKNTVVSLLSSLIVAFSYYVWFYSEIAEVFMLNALLAILLLFLGLKIRREWNARFFYFLALVLGLSFAHHHTIVFIIPSLLILLVPQRKRILKEWKACLRGGVFLLLGLSIYGYVPIASSHNPPVNWDSVHDIPSFIHLLLRKDYGTFNAGIFAPPVPLQRIVLLRLYASHVLAQMTIPVAVLCGAGVIYLWKKDKNYLIAVVTGIVLAGPVFIAYAGFPPYNSFFIGIFERFFLLSFVWILLLLPFGFMGVLKLLEKTFLKKYQALFLAVFLLIPLLLFKFNFPKTNLSWVFIGDVLGLDNLSPLPQNAVLFSSGDTVLFNTWYMHYVNNIRSDVRLINANGVSEDSFFQRKQKEYKALHPKTDPRDLVARTIEFIGTTTPVFSYLQIQPAHGDKLKWVPYGLNYMLVSDHENTSIDEFTSQTEQIWSKLSPLQNDGVVYGNYTIAAIPTIYSDALLATGTYFLSEYRSTDAAQIYYDKAWAVDPNNPKVYLIRGLNYLTAKDCRKAEEELLLAMKHEPLNVTAYFLLYASYSQCSHNTQARDDIVRKFKTTFQEDMFVALKNSFKK